MSGFLDDISCMSGADAVDFMDMETGDETTLPDPEPPTDEEILENDIEPPAELDPSPLD